MAYHTYFRSCGKKIKGAPLLRQRPTVLRKMDSAAAKAFGFAEVRRDGRSHPREDKAIRLVFLLSCHSRQFKRITGFAASPIFDLPPEVFQFSGNIKGRQRR